MIHAQPLDLLTLVQRYTNTQTHTLHSQVFGLCRVGSRAYLVSVIVEFPIYQTINHCQTLAASRNAPYHDKGQAWAAAAWHGEDHSVRQSQRVTSHSHSQLRTCLSLSCRIYLITLYYLSLPLIAFLALTWTTHCYFCFEFARAKVLKMAVWLLVLTSCRWRSVNGW